MKKTIFTLLVVLIGAIAYFAVNFIGWSRIETKLTSQGTIKSTINEVQASGWDLRTVSWIDAHGRYCTTLFTNDKGGTIDCDFKPEITKELLSEMKNKFNPENQSSGNILKDK